MMRPGKRPIENPPPVDSQGRDTAAREELVNFFPDDDVTESRLRGLLRDGTVEDRAWAISHLLRYAPWDDIWTYVSQDEVREIFARIELSESLRSAWARMLKIHPDGEG